MIEEKNIKVHLVSRFFEPLNQGVGRIAQDLKSELEKEYNIITTQCWGKKNVHYVIYNWLTRFFTPKKADVHLAVTSMESNFLPPDKSIAIVYDLIPLLHTLKCTTHYNASFYNVLGAFAFFYQTLFKTRDFKKIVCISEETKLDYLEVTKCHPDKVSVIDCWIQDKYKFQDLPMNNKIIIGTMSVVDKRKRSDILIKEFMKINDDNIELHIGGSGALLDELKELARNDGRIKFHGFVPEEDMLNFYKMLDIFIFPASHEGFGIPIIEAIAVGRPVITIKDSFIPRKVISLTNQIEWPELYDIIKRTKNNLNVNELKFKSDYVCKEFDIKTKINEYKKIINEVYLNGRK